MTVGEDARTWSGALHDVVSQFLPGEVSVVHERDRPFSDKLSLT
eukprot:CAMPEP_0185560206 /NCGR_PEP_ID=MMETSP1381-20130426/56415_1 /TAXON_ID=298111 /ORGANISM="Pavlova sp., Strain CCMP459" /LENGTH=43 /DNA_ID= /DNA_START= /DNA_END= /DNA_ORIENTATION=